ncbi:MAG: N-acetylmannosamine-6-phosphate 2-epimerase [Spirochaetia bacterium]
MNKKELLESLQGQLIVSCQALPDEPLHSPFIMGRLALAAQQGGAKGIRANTVADIQAIKESVDLPIFGIIKEVYADCPVFITPTMKEIDALVRVGVEVIACDATSRTRPGGQTLAQLMQEIKRQYPDQLLMADIATLEEAQHAQDLGFDFIATTLHGYTQQTQDMDVAYNDFEFLKQVIEAVRVPIVAEGKVDTPEKATRVKALGVHCLVVGSAITRPQLITEKFVQALS